MARSRKRPRKDPNEEALRRAEEFVIDLSLLRANLKLTPTERLEDLRRMLTFVDDLRRAVLESERADPGKADARPVR